LAKEQERKLELEMNSNNNTAAGGNRISLREGVAEKKEDPNAFGTSHRISLRVEKDPNAILLEFEGLGQIKTKEGQFSTRKPSTARRTSVDRNRDVSNSPPRNSPPCKTIEE
jgi:hypothetical protein